MTQSSEADGGSTDVRYRVSHPKAEMHPLNLEFADLVRDMRERGWSWEEIQKFAEITAENVAFCNTDSER